MNEWDHKDEWRRFGKDFLVTITRHAVEPTDDSEGPNRWAVYAYIYPRHRMFANFSGADMLQPAAIVLPLHCGPSYLQWHGDPTAPTSVQIGADYNHLYDENFSLWATPEEAREVFADADTLFNFLSMT